MSHFEFLCMSRISNILGYDTMIFFFVRISVILCECVLYSFCKRVNFIVFVFVPLNILRNDVSLIFCLCASLIFCDCVILSLFQPMCASLNYLCLFYFCGCVTLIF